MSQAPLSKDVVVEARQVRKAYGRHVVLAGVDLDLKAGDIVLLDGDNGAGKTTLINILTGSLTPDAGSIVFNGAKPRRFAFPRRFDLFDGFSPEAVSQLDVARSWQDVRLFGAQSVRDNVVLAAKHHPGEEPWFALFAPGRVDAAETRLRKEADALLERLGLSGRGQSSAGKISVGQAKRVAIARAVAAGAHTIFLDEPFSGLDQAGGEETAALLKTLNSERNITMVIVEHASQRHWLAPIVTKHWLLRDGRLEASSPSLGADPGLNLTARLLGLGATQVVTSLPGGAALHSLRLPDRVVADAALALEIKDLVVRRGGRPVVGAQAPLNFTLAAGEIGVLEAPNGWGKSTLLQAIAGLIPIESGEVRLWGRRLDHLATWRRARAGLQMLPAEDVSYPNLTTSQALEVATRDTRQAKAPFDDRLASSLSGGELRRLALQALAPARVTLLDEPLAKLDDAASRAAIDQITQPSLGAVLAADPARAMEAVRTS